MNNILDFFIKNPEIGKKFIETYDSSKSIVEALQKHNIKICDGSCAFDSKKLNEILEKGKQP